MLRNKDIMGTESSNQQDPNKIRRKRIIYNEKNSLTIAGSNWISQDKQPINLERTVWYHQEVPGYN